jgi:UDP-glucose 4-epimerase
MDTTPEVIVTGGAGYIGSHTVVDLQRAGYRVVVVDNLSNAREETLDHIAGITGARPVFYRADVSRPEELLPLLQRHRQAVGVIHFAAYKAVGESVERPLDYYANNLGGLITLLRGMADLGMDRLIFSSSCTVYGQPAVLPVTEDSPIQAAASPYGNTKQIGEEILLDAVTAGLFRGIISLRYFNPVGADPSARIGEVPLGVPNNLMPYITQTAAGLRRELLVFGSDYQTPDGTAIRDYIHVCDLAAAHRVALERLVHGRQEAPYEVFNIGTGRGYSVLEVIRAFERVKGVGLPWRFTDRRPGDIEQVWADTRCAEAVLGWKASHGLDDMVASAWAWERNYRASLKDGDQ